MTLPSLIAAGPSHAAVIAALHGLCFDDVSESSWGDGAVAELIAMPGAFAFIASRQQQPLGFVLARLAADEGEIISIGTAPDARRQGVAGFLLDAVIEKTMTDGAHRIFLEVAADNAAALGFYRGRGFNICGRRPGYYRRAHGPMDAHVLIFESKSKTANFV